MSRFPAVTLVLVGLAYLVFFSTTKVIPDALHGTGILLLGIGAYINRGLAFSKESVVGSSSIALGLALVVGGVIALFAS